MKKLSVFLLLTVSLFSCTKSDNSSIQNNSSSGLFSKMINSSPGHSVITLFTYDNYQRLISSKAYSVDTFNGSVKFDTSAIIYGYLENNKLANYSIAKSGTSTIIDSFYYDSQNRLIKDTSIQNSSNGFGYSSIYCNYSNDMVIAKYWNSYHKITAPMNDTYNGEIDSLILTNGNVTYQTHKSYYFQNGVQKNIGTIVINTSFTNYLSQFGSLNPTNSPYYSKYLEDLSTTNTSSGTTTINKIYSFNANGSISKTINNQIGNSSSSNTTSYFYQ